MNLTNHLLSRGLDTSKYKCWVSDCGTWVTFPLYDFKGALRGYQTYNPNVSKGHSADPTQAKYVTHSSVPCVWGLETLTGKERVVFVTESVIKAVAVHNAGYPALSLLGSSPAKRLLASLIVQPYTVVAIGDNDTAGLKLARKLNGFVSPKDLDEMSTEEVKNLLANY